MNKFVRGSVWFYFNATKEKNITYGCHPCLIISNDKWNESSETVSVIPISSKPIPGTSKDKYNFNYPSYLVVSQVTTISKSQIRDLVGIASKETVESAIQLLSTYLTNNDEVDQVINMKWEKQLYRSASNNQFNSSKNGYKDKGHTYKNKTYANNYSKPDSFHRRDAISFNSYLPPSPKPTNETKKEKWTDDAKRELILLYEDGGKSAVSSHFKISEKSASLYYYKWRHEVVL